MHGVEEPKPAKSGENGPQLIVILQSAALETVKTGNIHTLLNSDDHHSILKKAGRDVAQVRPDITHQCLLTLLDSPLSKAGRLKVYISTEKGVLIDVHPSIRIPRTYKRFAGLFVQLLHKLSIRAINGNHKLLKVIKNPITDHLPPNARKITLSSEVAPIRLSSYVKTLTPNEPVVFFIGAMARGSDDWVDDIIDEKISISEYPLSASVTCGKLTDAFEELWDIL